MVPQTGKLLADLADLPVSSSGDAIVADHPLPIRTRAAIGVPGPVAQPLSAGGNVVEGRKAQLARKGQLPQSPLTLGL